MADTLSKRAAHALQFPNPKWEMLEAVNGNWYHPDTNPHGVIDLGTAENMLCEDIMMERLNKPDMMELDASQLYYGPVYEDIKFRTCIAEFLKRKMKAVQDIKQENVVGVVGAGGAFDVLLHNLADPGEVFLTPAPYYYWLASDIGYRAQVTCVGVPIDGDGTSGEGMPRGALSVAKLDHALAEVEAQGKVVKGVAINNPQNPTGEVYPISIIVDILNWAASKRLHIIINEIYGLTTFDAVFKSVLSLSELPDPDRTHYIWGISKDMTLSGFRVGIIHSWNAPLTRALQAMRLFCAVPGLVQAKVTRLLEDTAWLDGVFFPTNHARLRGARDRLIAWLDARGVPHTTPQSTFYVWADFSKYLGPGEAEMELFQRFAAGGVYAEPGHIFHGRRRGCFRILYTVPPAVLDLALSRMETVLGKNEEALNA